ncbi:putative lipid II flippase FtsW [Paludicola sp. MB14-C6]|uniref:putative lipid II flippase FtsW n=1 Tax=Paludihabitans sp. MB14-C6 TaxID=3070656 RepID=UPI0027DB4EAF|nr:putative lipid II flippase FtsW [Paludicola sp. MB14-C6]WMJ23761.1 putative lipid II flippase FtsW [Paludicola sp. MB14-C6]
MVFSASYAYAVYKFDNSLYYVLRQGIFVIMGVISMYGISFIDYHVYRRYVFPIFLIGIALLIAVLFIGERLNGAKRWINIGFTTFQPSEIMKFALIVMFAHLSTLNYKRMGTFTYGVLPYAICLMTVAALMMQQPHLSGTILMFLIGFVMMFIAGTKFRYFAILGGAGGLAAVALILFKGKYMASRITNWLHPFENLSDENWQTAQSLIAIGSGGIMGRGIGNSHQKFLYLPEPYNDFIFAIVCEELGLVGALLVIVLFVLFTFRGFSIASKAPDKFGYMLGIGLVAQICIQAILNIAVVTNTIPNTGISLPFFSYGGTALMMQLGQMGILLNISRQATMEKT